MQTASDPRIGMEEAIETLADELAGLSAGTDDLRGRLLDASRRAAELACEAAQLEAASDGR